MYRRDYADIPGLFDARFREYNKPNLYKEFQNSWLISIIGICMVIGGCGTLFWNEGRAVRVSVSLQEGLRDVLVPETKDVVFDENNGKLVLVSGELTVPDPLVDPTYGISINAVKLKRIVQVYQWYEVEDERTSNAGGLPTDDHDTHVAKTYSYYTDWFEYPVDSNNFYSTLGHHNPHTDQWPLESTASTNPRVKLGNFLLGTDLKEKFEDYRPFTSDERPRIEGVKIHTGLYYHSENVWDPQVGDYRVQFSYAGRRGEEFTIVGRQSGREIRPYQTETGEELLILHPGIKTPQDVFRREENHNKFATNVYRLTGWLVLFLGLSCLSNLIEALMDLYPWIRRTMDFGISSVQFSLSLALFFSIMGVGWLWYRPLFGAFLLMVAVVPAIIPVLYKQYQKRKERYLL